VGFIEDLIRDEVLPHYANTHTESTGTGRQTTRLREDARATIHRAVHGTDETVVIFTGTGSTGAINKIVGILGLRLPADLDREYALSTLIPRAQRPVVFIGPYEHHSNELPWRESIADVVTIPEDADGHVDVDRLTAELERYAERPLKIGSFSAASNVTGILTDTVRITDVLHGHGALAFWDYAAAAPYVDIDASDDDAVFLSPHKFIGGPGTPGVLVVNRRLLTNSVPETVGGGTVAYVNPLEHRYLDDATHREEAGTPGIIESIRAGLVFALKDAVGVETIHRLERGFLDRALAAWREHPAIQVLGNPDADRLSIVSFVITRPGGRYLHHNVVVAILNDLFGIQSRGGCSCAGPYGHRLLGLDIERSHEFEREITGGCEGIKPGWVRVSFNYFISEEVFRYIVDAVSLVADHGHKLVPQYRFSPDTGLWRHRTGLIEPPLRLAQLSYDETGRLIYPRHEERAPESALAEYLAEARDYFASLPDPFEDGDHPHVADERLSADFEHLRWFDLPAVCLEHEPTTG
jgi:selenocysteine lyase/cysteine desulfurase